MLGILHPLDELLTTPPHRLGKPPYRPNRPPRHPAVALPATILLGLLSAFFAWQAAEPLWLAMGHGVPGTATATNCDPIDGEVAEGRATIGSTYPCVAFEASGGSFLATDVTLVGAGPAARVHGASTPARMVAADRERAFAANPVALHLRWSAGLLLVFACGAAIAWATGAHRLDDARYRRQAVLLSFAGPLLLTVGFLTAAS
jgi:hypothetical protein